jgi:photosystem II stability/assembly factor-like uncharacterized protein
MEETVAAKSAAESTVIQEPGGGVWRLEPAGTVSYSSDGRSNWTVQLTEPTIGFRAGAAPSRSVCWIAGRNGAVRRTTNAGLTWDVVNVPDRVDLVSITAMDGNRAMVIAGNGSAYSTADGGRSWTKQ